MIYPPIIIFWCMWIATIWMYSMLNDNVGIFSFIFQEKIFSLWITHKRKWSKAHIMGEPSYMCESSFSKILIMTMLSSRMLISRFAICSMLLKSLWLNCVSVVAWRWSLENEMHALFYGSICFFCCIFLKSSNKELSYDWM